MNRSSIYYWRNNEVVEMDSTHRVITDGLLHLPCADARFEDSLNRYGEFNATGWVHIPIEKFPPEFRAHLLLLGVSS